MYQSSIYYLLLFTLTSTSTPALPCPTHRQALWSAGLDYNHGTGHGVGAFLNVHEGPQGTILLSLQPTPLYIHLVTIAVLTLPLILSLIHLLANVVGYLTNILSFTYILTLLIHLFYPLISISTLYRNWFPKT